MKLDKSAVKKQSSIDVNPTPEPIPDVTPKSSKNLTWLWVTIGIVVTLVLVAVVFFVYVRFIRKHHDAVSRNESIEEQDEKGPHTEVTMDEHIKTDDHVEMTPHAYL